MSNAMILLLDKGKIQEIRSALKELSYYDDSRRIIQITDQKDHQSKSFLPQQKLDSTLKFAFPITDVCSRRFLYLQENKMTLPHPFENCVVKKLDLPLSKKSLATQANPSLVLHSALLGLLNELYCEEVTRSMMEYVPNSWERHGDMVLLPPDSFSSLTWQLHIGSENQSVEFWSIVSNSLRCKRLALNNRISDDDFRSSGARLLLGEDGWVDHVDNKIHYIFDITKCMFSSGNITEKLRVGKFDCQGETVLDLYAGIGYFVFPYLVHARAELVHACEWNPHAVEALKKGLKANRIEDKCIIHYGDNRKVGLKDVANRINAGLIPSSEEAWPTACAALKVCTGGWLHIHGTVATKEPENNHFAQDTVQYNRYSHLLSSKSLKYNSVVNWIDYVCKRVLYLLGELNPTSGNWKVEVRHVEHVKLYAPHVSHLVLDIECRPH